MVTPKLYPINQSALYKVGSKARLAKILCTSVSNLIFLAESKKNYRLFELPEEVCPFTNKKKKARWVQEPKPELRRIHERIQTLLKRITPPNYAHAAIKGLSYSTNAAAHKNSDRVATFDIRRFYPSTLKSHVFNFFAYQLKCAPDVAALLATLICYKDASSGRDGLPTGSPLSPILSLFANKPMFDELSDIAATHGLVFTCYVDDLTFSGTIIPKGLPHLVSAILGKNGHLLSTEKTKIFRKYQAKHVTGVVLLHKNIYVPHCRFKKARAVAAALKVEKDTSVKLSLIQKLAGLLGEAAFLDKRYAKWAKRSYDDLRKVREEIESNKS